MIIGDSAIVIEAMINSKNPNNSAMNRIYKRIRLNLKGLGRVNLKHVLREHNKEFDNLANKAIEREAGSIKENNEIYCSSIP